MRSTAVLGHGGPRAPKESLAAGRRPSCAHEHFAERILGNGSRKRERAGTTRTQRGVTHSTDQSLSEQNPPVRRSSAKTRHLLMRLALRLPRPFVNSYSR